MNFINLLSFMNVIHFICDDVNQNVIHGGDEFNQEAQFHYDNKLHE